MIKLEEYLYCRVENAGKQDKNGYKIYALITNTQKGKIVFKFWNSYEKDFLPMTGDFLKIHVFDLENAANELEQYKTLSLDGSRGKPYYCSYEKIEEDQVPKKFLDIINKDIKKQISFANDLLQSSSNFSDEMYHDFLITLLKKHIDKFTTAPAAVSKHHTHKGGLFVHSSEVFSNCYSIVNASCNKNFYSNQINSDVLYMSAWLHDLGKIEVYYFDEKDNPKINYEKESLVGHSTISNNLFLESARNSKYLDIDFINNVSHCILSHHERKEWGAVVEPQTIEAIILCRADFISSRIS